VEWQLHHHSVERQLHKYYGKVHYGNTVLLYSHMEVFSLLGNFSSSLLSSGPGANPDTVMEQIKAQLAQAYAQEFLGVKSLFLLLIDATLLIPVCNGWLDCAC